MIQRENAVLTECIRAFVHHRFMYLDAKVMNQYGICEALKQFTPEGFNGIFWRSNTGAVRVGRSFIRYGIAGCPDLTGFSNKGKFVACEVKTATGRVSKTQKEFHGAMLRAGADCFVARCYAEADDYLKLLGY